MYDIVENGDTAYEFNGSNSITITLAEQVLTCPGDVYLSVVFMDEEEILSTFKIIVNVDINPGADVAESEDYFSIQAAINAAIQSFDSPVFYVVVSGNDRTGYILVTPGRDIIAAQRSRKVIACNWLDKNVYIPLAKEYSDSDVSFSGVIKGTEYYVRVNPVDNIVLNAFTRPVGVGFDNVYIGSDEPASDSVQLWINPESSNDVPPYIPAPTTAEVGQTMVVQSVDEDGRPTAWEPAYMDNGVNTVYVTVTRQGEDYVSDRSYDELISALEQGLDVCCLYSWYRLPLVSRTVSELWFCGMIDKASVRVKFTRNGSGYSITVNRSNLIPTPEQASVGQIMAVKAVDVDGRPIAWEPVDLPSGGGGLKYFGKVTVSENVTAIAVANIDGVQLNAKRIAIFGVLAASGESTWVNPSINNTHFQGIQYGVEANGSKNVRIDIQSYNTPDGLYTSIEYYAAARTNDYDIYRQSICKQTSGDKITSISFRTGDSNTYIAEGSYLHIFVEE